MLIYYVRHGDPIYDPDMLTPLGEQQAAALAKRLAVFGVDEVFASTSNRAIQTATPTCEILGRKLHTLDFLNENYLDGLKLPKSEGGLDWLWAHSEYSQILASREVRALGEDWYSHSSLRCFGFEKVLEPINDQLDDFLASLGYEHDKEKGLLRLTLTVLVLCM